MSWIDDIDAPELKVAIAESDAHFTKCMVSRFGPRCSECVRLEQNELNEHNKLRT
jgi:hypothetical protein